VHLTERKKKHQREKKESNPEIWRTQCKTLTFLDLGLFANMTEASLQTWIQDERTNITEILPRFLSFYDKALPSCKMCYLMYLMNLTKLPWMWLILSLVGGQKFFFQLFYQFCFNYLKLFQKKNLYNHDPHSLIYEPKKKKKKDKVLQRSMTLSINCFRSNKILSGFPLQFFLRIWCLCLYESNVHDLCKKEGK